LSLTLAFLISDVAMSAYKTTKIPLINCNYQTFSSFLSSCSDWKDKGHAEVINFSPLFQSHQLVELAYPIPEHMETID